MSTLTKPFTFTGGTFAVASQVNSDFDTLFGWVNGGSAIWADASHAFTAIPSGPSSDPSSANQFTRKQYVDNRLIGNVNGTTAPSATASVKMCVGNNTVTANAGVNQMTFPFGFATAPMVVCQLFAVHGTATTIWVVQQTSAGFQVEFWNAASKINSGNFQFNWIAIGT